MIHGETWFVKEAEGRSRGQFRLFCGSLAGWQPQLSDAGSDCRRCALLRLVSLGLIADAIAARKFAPRGIGASVALRVASHSGRACQCLYSGGSLHKCEIMRGVGCIGLSAMHLGVGASRAHVERPSVSGASCRGTGGRSSSRKSPNVRVIPDSRILRSLKARSFVSSASAQHSGCCHSHQYHHASFLAWGNSWRVGHARSTDKLGSDTPVPRLEPCAQRWQWL